MYSHVIKTEQQGRKKGDWHVSTRQRYCMPSANRQPPDVDLGPRRHPTPHLDHPVSGFGPSVPGVDTANLHALLY